jgi:hypothetical protein
VSQKKVGRLRQRRHASAAGEQNGQRRADAPPPKAYTTQHRPFRPLQAQKISLTLMRTNRAVQSGRIASAAQTTPGELSRPGRPPPNPRTCYLTLSTNGTALCAGQQRVAAPRNTSTWTRYRAGSGGGKEYAGASALRDIATGMRLASKSHAFCSRVRPAGRRARWKRRRRFPAFKQ